MGLLDLIAAYAIAQGSHTGGHFNQATNQANPMNDVPMGLSVKQMAELWRVPDKWKDSKTPFGQSHEDYLKDNDKKKTDIHGSGFAMQDKLRDNLTGKEREDVSKINALIKAFYIAGGPQMLSKLDGSQGDIKEMQRLSGNKYVPHMVGLTALSDLLQTGKSRSSLGFMVENGQPGIKFNYRW